MPPIFSIARNAFLEAIRQPIFIVLVLVGLLAMVCNVNLAAFTMGEDEKLLIDLCLSTLLIVGLLLAAVLCNVAFSAWLAARRSAAAARANYSDPLRPSWSVSARARWPSSAARSAISAGSDAPSRKLNAEWACNSTYGGLAMDEPVARRLAVHQHGASRLDDHVEVGTVNRVIGPPAVLHAPGVTHGNHQAPPAIGDDGMRSTPGRGDHARRLRAA